jgi:FkbM family methyltransferase
MLSLIRAYKYYPYRIPARVKFFNFFRFFVRFRWAEEWIAKQIFRGSDFWKKAVPPIYFYQPGAFRKVTRNGIAMELDLSNLVDHAIFFGVPKEKGLENLLSLAKVDSVVFDVGANIGFLTLRFASACTNGFVYSFEPGRKNFARLQKNLALNSLLNIKAFQMALGERTESKQLYEMYSFNTGANRILNTSVEKKVSETVSVSSLDDVVASLNLDRLDILKIDVEGYELFVLRGGQKTIERFMPILFVELADDNLKHHNLSSRDVIQFILKMNYSIVDARTVKPLDVNTDKFHIDILCFPNQKN